jgi:hypothetical protein
MSNLGNPTLENSIKGLSISLMEFILNEATLNLIMD